MTKFWVSGIIALVVQSQATFAQKIDDERMRRDIEVAENVLSTLIKQEVNQQRGFFGLEIKGTYQEGYGVTFRLPGDYAMPMVFTMSGAKANIVYSDDIAPTIAYTRSREETPEARELPERKEAPERKERKEAAERKETTERKEATERRETYELKEQTKEKRRMAADSARDAYNKKIVKAAKDFIVDYGDFVSQLGPNERIVVTNQGENKSWYFKENKRTHISVEGSKADITAFKQGKITRDQALAKLKVVNTETVEVKEPDMELLESIFARLYRQDLSTTYFTENNVYYERLKDYGVIYYMNVSSSYRDDFNHHRMPTVGLEDIDEKARDKKVVELYPKFEQELKENMLEYGRTLKTLTDDEVLVFHITLTKCKDCGIPSTVELTVKSAVLKDYGAGKLDKNTAVSKFTVKKGANQ
jgi:hypothetical protein